MKSGAVIVFALCSAAAACGHGAPPAPPPAPAITSARLDSSGTLVLSDTLPRDTVSVQPTEVTRQAVEVFGDSLAVAPPPVDSTTAVEPSDDGPTWDIDVRSYETQRRVEHFVSIFAGPARDRFAQRVERGTRYEPMIRAKLKAAGLPEDMTYLALIESGYYPHAYSRAAAVGLWQLMTGTAQGAGIRVDWWIDERRDPVRSTDAAIKFLRYLKDQFGSLYLAAAAYNGGPGRISRGLSRYADDLEGTEGEDVFFALAEKDYLRAETKDYVPQLIAAALVAKDPTRYGLRITPHPPYEYDSVRVGAATPLAAVAKATGTPMSEMRELNSDVLRGMTPPSGAWYVRVPTGRADGFESSFAALDKGERTAVTHVTSKKGESLASIARRAGLSARQLAWYNPRVRPLKSGRLRPGTDVVVPSAAVVSAALDVPDPSIERYGSSARVKIHVVRRGESLGLIARRYHTSVATIMRLNGLRKTTVFPGQALAVRGRAARARGSHAARGRGRGGVKRAAVAKGGKSAKAVRGGHSGGTGNRLAATPR